MTPRQWKPGPTTRLLIISLVVGISGLVTLLAPPFAQPLDYHDFADQRRILAIPNFWNVLTSLAFVLAGGLGLQALVWQNSLTLVPALKPAYRLFFIAVALVGIGSAFYHLAPSNSTLTWDRLPMAAGFMALLAIIIGEYLSQRAGRLLLFPLLAAGITAGVYWHVSELRGEGDLRFYALVQFLPVVLILVILLIYPSRFTHIRYLAAMLVLYLFSKTAELLDKAVYDWTGSISGHSIKHLVAALAVYCFYLWLKRRGYNQHA